MIYIIYHLRESGVYLIKPPSSKVSFPANVDSSTFQVMFDDFCDIPMKYIGIEEQGHEFKCGAQPGQCLCSELCPQFRYIDFNNGYFQRIFYYTCIILSQDACIAPMEKYFF